MPGVKVGPTEGLVLECAFGAVAVISTIECVQAGTDFLPICLGSWFLTLVNIPQAIRFFSDKPARKHYGRFDRAIKILKRPNSSEESKKKAFDAIVEAARDNYAPAQDFLNKIHNSQSG